MAVYFETIRSFSFSATACRSCSTSSSGALLRGQRIQPPPRPAPCSSFSSSSSSISQFHEDSYISSWINCTTTSSAHAALYLAQSCNYRIPIIRSSKHKLVSKSGQLLPCVAAATACKSHAWIPCIESEIVGQSCNGFSITASSSSSSSPGCEWGRIRACVLLNFKFVAHNRPIITASSKNYSLPRGHDDANDEKDFDSDSDGDGDGDGGSKAQEQQQDCLQPISSDDELQAGSAVSSSTPPPAAPVASPNDVPSEEGDREAQLIAEESWLLVRQDGDAEDHVPTLVSTLPWKERYAPRRLLELVTRKIDLLTLSLAQLRSTPIMFWQKKENTQELYPSFGAYAFQEKKGISQFHQWTATELTLQHAQLSRIARDVLYLIFACSLLGIARILESLVATFSSSPPRYAKLLDAANSLDFFTMAFLAHSLRKPLIGILYADPSNLDLVFQLKAKIWDEMHKFYERQWKVVATLGVGRLLALLAQTLPSTNTLTKNIKMGWEMLLALPIF